jgi:hypothetical protein
MDVRIDIYTLERAAERGTNAEEIRDVVASGTPIRAKHGRLAKVRIYDFKQYRRGKYYEQKRVEVFYTAEADVIVTITVYVFYGKSEIDDADHI